MKIIIDLFNQHSGDLEELKRLALSGWISGADAVKIQLFKSEVVWGDASRRYMEMTFDEVKSFHDYCKSMGIEFAATPFDEEKVEWLDDLNVDYYKVASVTAKKHPDLVEKILARNKKTIISLGQYPENVFPFGFDKNIEYMYCVSKYPTRLDDEKVKNMPTFTEKGYSGYSDHTLGISAAIKSYFQGASFLEKHFTHNRNAQKNCELAHLCSFTPESLRQYTNLIKEFNIMKKE